MCLLCPSYREVSPFPAFLREILCLEFDTREKYIFIVPNPHLTIGRGHQYTPYYLKRAANNRSLQKRCARKFRDLLPVSIRLRNEFGGYGMLNYYIMAFLYIREGRQVSLQLQLHERYLQPSSHDGRKAGSPIHPSIPKNAAEENYRTEKNVFCSVFSLAD